MLVLLLVGAALLAALALGATRWHAGTAALRARLEATRRTAVPAPHGGVVPAPVAAYLAQALPPGGRPVAAVRLAHTGTFDLGGVAPRWKPFRSDQRVIVARPGFDWDARVFAAPGLTVFVHDAYLAGEGILRASLAGLRDVAYEQGGGALAEGELLRFLAEAAWYPTALAGRVRWEPIDAASARGTLEDGAVRASLDFRFGGDGLLESVHAGARPRAVDGRLVPTPWQGRFWNYARREGMLVPLEAEVAWLLPEGPRPYWRGNLLRIAYEFEAR